MVEPDVANYGIYIDGDYTATSDGARLPVHNPATGELWATIADASADDVARAVDATQSTFETSWGATTPATRGRLLPRLADVIERRADELAAYEVRDNGKLLREMGAQLRALPNWYRYYAGLADKIQGETVPMERPSLFNYTTRQPFGVIGCITPWTRRCCWARSPSHPPSPPGTRSCSSRFSA